MKYLKFTVFTFTFFQIICVNLAYAQTDFPNPNWKQYVNTEEVGFSKDSLELLKNRLDSLDTSSLLVVYKGHVLFSYGENTRKFMIHSIRKNIMHAMIGREVEKGTIKLNQTLSELNIDDIGSLTSSEKNATIKDLLSARSGIYHQSAYSTTSMVKNLPKRESHKPGTFWYYNNWDFNTLLTIYDKQANKKFFKAFKTEIAEQLGMQDFGINDTFYMWEKEKSMHPAYLFKMSSRDMARFGLLYLNNGNWNGEQLISKNWVEMSVKPQSSVKEYFSSRDSYGMLWWVSMINDKKMYYASGFGGHRIIVIPEDDLVIVHRVNTYQNYAVKESDVNNIVSKILKAKYKRTSRSIDSESNLVLYKPSNKVYENIYKESMDKYIGTYKHPALGEASIQKTKSGYSLLTEAGLFNLYAQSQNTFIIQDMEIPIVLKRAPLDDKMFSVDLKIINGNIGGLEFYY